MQQDEKQNVSRETLEGSVDMLDIARVAQDVEAREFAGMGSLKLVAPAKVNLYLNVKGVRDDGYHEVSTTMHALMLHDVLRMKIIPGTGEAVKLTTRSFEGLAPLDVDPQDNIVMKAILKLAEAFGRTLGEEETMRVHLEKRIPVQAGLGGGSSDAAAALLGSAVLWGESVLDPRIKEVAAQLGADVVFFLQGGCALYDGIGENLVRTLKPMNDFLVLVKPEGGVSTAEVADYIQNELHIPTLAHLICMGNDETCAAEILDQLEAVGVRDVLALRGDRSPARPESPDFKHASDLTSFIKWKKPNFSVHGACYPEGHPEADTLLHDVENLRIKQAAGAEHLLTQLFFDNMHFYRFLNLARRAGITLPVSAGVMPIVKRSQIERTVALSSASLPSDFTRMISRYQDDPASLYDAGIDYAVNQLRDLIEGGADGIHLYAMNDAAVAAKVYDGIRDLL